MLRTVSVVAALATAAGTASAAFLGFSLREDKTPPSAEGLVGFPGAANMRVFNMYAVFDGEGGPAGTAGRRNNVLNVGQVEMGAFFGINLDVNPGANFYRPPGAAGSNLIGGINEAGAGDNRREWATYLSIGVKRFDGDYGPIFGDDTASDPDFGAQDSDGMQFNPLSGNDRFTGGWFNSNPPNLQAAAADNGQGEFVVFLGQLGIVGLAPGAAAWAGEGPAPSFANGTWFTEVLTGELTIFTQGDVSMGDGPSIAHRIVFDIPTPGALALFGVAGLVASRRRRA